MKQNRLEELRDILLRPDLEKLEDLSGRIEESERRAADVAEVLPDSISKSFRKDSRLISALRTPLRQCVSESVREDPEEYADALFPIMGPAIRRAVAEAFKAWIQQANQAIEQSLSPRGLNWRFQAWRVGVPYGQYVLQRTLVYKVEDVYLIHSASGLLVGHATDGGIATKDEDAVSAMFTVIQEFVKDSFTREQPQRLRTAELGELTLWAVHGPSTTIVAVIRGVPPATLRTELETTLELIETREGNTLRDYSGNRDSMLHLEADLRSCLLMSLNTEQPSSEGMRLSPALALLTLLAVGVVAWLGYGVWDQGRLTRVADAFAASPGVVITDLERDGDTIVLRGLRDPLAQIPAEIAAGAGWTGRVADEFRPFLSLEDELVLERARVALSPPESVTIQLTAGKLVLEGIASAIWIDGVDSAAADVPGVSSVDRAALLPDDVTLLAKLTELLDPPPTAALALDGSVLLVSGEAPKNWLDTVVSAGELPGVVSIEYSAVVFSEQIEMQAIEDEVNTTGIGFASGELAPSVQEDGSVARLSRMLIEYHALATTLGLIPSLTLTGHSDATGSDALNRALEQRRAESLAAVLGGAGVDMAWIRTQSQLASDTPGVRTPQVTVHLQAGVSAEIDGQD